MQADVALCVVVVVVVAINPAQDGLPDLNHSNPTVVKRLLDWHGQIDRQFSFDGYRIDAAGLSAPVGAQPVLATLSSRTPACTCKAGTPL